MWDGRDLGNMGRLVTHSVVICTNAGRYHEAAAIDGWLGERGHDLVPADIIRHRQARADIDAQLGDGARRVRSQAAQWEPATAIEYILTTLRAVSETSPS